jgi:NAD(P)-dependent dehydrogenase (short-subunit alcohol dehydrogenase family)
MSGEALPRRALVTGAARGIGAEVVARLLKDGHRVLATDLKVDGEVLAALRARWPGALLTHAADLLDPATPDALVERVQAAFGGLDVLVNNAVVSRYEPFLEITRASWQEVIGVGLEAWFFLSQAVARSMVAARIPGTVVNLASINSFAAEANASHYAIVKGGVAQMTRALAVELAPHGIRVNAVAPGPVRTPHLAAIQDGEGFAAMLSRVPLGRVGRAEEIASVVAFLASAESSYVTGSIVLADGGFMAGL